jgi:chromate transporter
MHRILVEEKRWIGERPFLHALNCCMLLPGPKAQQFAVYFAGCCTGRAAGWSPARCSCSPASSPSRP